MRQDGLGEQEQCEQQQGEELDLQHAHPLSLAQFAQMPEADIVLAGKEDHLQTVDEPFGDEYAAENICSHDDVCLHQAVLDRVQALQADLVHPGLDLLDVLGALDQGQHQGGGAEDGGEDDPNHLDRLEMLLPAQAHQVVPGDGDHRGCRYLADHPPGEQHRGGGAGSGIARVGE